MPRTRDLARIDYSKLNAKGFDSDSFEMDVLNLSDPNSDYLIMKNITPGFVYTFSCYSFFQILSGVGV
jgi:hypothetical protein